MRTVRARPTGGTLSLYEPASGPGIRIDGFGYTGYRTSSKFDSLLAKVIVYTADGDLAAAARKAERALSEFRIAGVSTNISFLRALLRTPAFAAASVHTRFIEEHAASLCAQAAELAPAENFERRAGRQARDARSARGAGTRQEQRRGCRTRPRAARARRAISQVRTGPPACRPLCKEPSSASRSRWETRYARAIRC